jgi:hypothetical protein
MAILTQSVPEPPLPVPVAMRLALFCRRAISARILLSCIGSFALWRNSAAVEPGKTSGPPTDTDVDREIAPPSLLGIEERVALTAQRSASFSAFQYLRRERSQGTRCCLYSAASARFMRAFSGGKTLESYVALLSVAAAMTAGDRQYLFTDKS